MNDPTVYQKLKMGAIMGGTIGLCIGFVFGSINILRYGPGNRGYLSSLATYMGSSAATFGFFMAIGTVIRTDPEAAEQMQRWRQLQQGMRQRPIPVYIREGIK